MDEQSTPVQPKQFVGLLRAYLNANGDTFIGRCPRCAAMVRINVVAEGGSNSQFFEAW
jgi:hypothetical protein